MEKHRLAAEPEFDQPSNLSANSECDRQRPNPESDPGPKVFEDRKRTGHRTRVRRLISVHALGQSAFCARAGILALEQGDDRDPLEPLPRLSYLPCFDREQIEEVLKQKIGNVGLAVLYGISMACLAAKGHFEQQRTFFLASFLMLIACLCWLVSLCIAISRLVSRRRAAIEAEARVPEPTVAGVQPVNWWSMLKAGFEPVAYQRPFRHPELALEGCPWRVLERDSLRIPVIRAGSRKLGDKPGELYAKHHLRLVAYSMLLEATDHFEVPYALVFPCDSPDGYAVPITDELRTWALQILTRFDEQVHASQQRQQEPPTPRQRSRCASCSYGFPVPITDREIKKFRKTGGSLLVLKSSNGKTFHCLCGDRFGSPPPHAKSIELELTTSLR